jgi:hypothetical protein
MGYLAVMVLVFYQPSRRKRRAAGGDSAGHGGAVCVVARRDQVLVLVAPVTEEGEVLDEEGWVFALWGGDAGDGRDLPDVEMFLLNRVKGIRPAGAEAIPVIDWRSGKQTGVAARDERGGYDIRDFEGRLSGAVRSAAIDTVTGAFLGMVIPGSGTTSLDAMISALEKLLEPREILLALVNAAARAIAIQAGLGIIAPLIGQFAENTARALLDREHATDRPVAARLLKGAKIAAYAESGTLAEGIADLFLTPAIKSALGNATAPISWAGPMDAQSAYDARVAPQLELRDASPADRPAAKEDPAIILRSAVIFSSAMKWDRPDDDPASAIGPAV